MSRFIRRKLTVFTALTLALLIAPFFSDAANFENPLGDVGTLKPIIKNLIHWLVGLSTLIALLSLVIGGMRLIIGGFDNEQEAAAAKKIITWAIIGLVVVGLAAAILWAIGKVLLI